MSDPALGLLMLGLIVVVIMMGFPTAFTLMGLGIVFGFVAFYDPSQHWVDNRVFDLMVQRTYGAMTNDVLISIPLPADDTDNRASLLAALARIRAAIQALTGLGSF